MKTNIFVFDGQTEELLTRLSNKDNDQCPFFSPVVLEQLNKDFTFEFSVPADHEDSRLLVRGNLVGIFDLDGNLQVFQIYRTEEEHTGEQTRKLVLAEHLFYEMKDDIVEDLRVRNGEALEAVTKAISSSRWEVGQVDSLGTGTVNFYYSDGVNNLTKVANTYGGELGYRFEFDGSKITRRLVDLLARRGQDSGKRFEFTKDLKSVKRTVQFDGIKTALYGRGKGEEIEETGGFTRKPTFKEVVWRTVDGDPVDKPLGQEWVGLPDALEKFGRENGTRHRFGVFDVDSTDPVEILQKTYEQLLEVSTPKVSYELSVITLETIAGYEHEKVRLGDTVFVIDRELGLTIEARVLEIKYDILNPENTEVVLGNFIDDITDYNKQIEEIQAKITDRAGVWDKADDQQDSEVNDGSIENIPPEVPKNVSAHGMFKSILLKWTFDPSILISAYEVYGSQVQGFTPDSSNLLYRGKSGGFTHNADTNQTWYFRIRAVNPHGVASGFTQEFSGSTIQLEQPDFENLTVYDAMIHSVSADKLTAGEIDANDVNIVNLNVDNVSAGRLKGEYLEINSRTVFENGYDPTTKATQDDIDNTVKDYTKPVMKEVYDASFMNGTEYWSDSPEGAELEPTTRGTIVESTEAEIGTSVLQVSGTGVNSFFSRNAIPVNTNRVYRVVFKVKATVGNPTVNSGIVCLDDNFNELGRRSIIGIEADSIKVEDGWQIYTGLVTNVGEEQDTFILGTKFVRPVFTISSDVSATAQVDFLEFEDVTEIQTISEIVQEVNLRTEDGKLISTVTESETYKEHMNAKADQQYLDDNFVLNETFQALDEYIDEELQKRPELSYIELTYATKSEVEQTANALDFKFSSSGGVNLLRNSVGFAGTDFWEVELDEDEYGIQIGSIDTVQNAELEARGAGSGFLLDGAKIRQTFTAISEFFTVAIRVSKDSSGTGYLKVIYDDDSYEIKNFTSGTVYDYEKHEIVIEPLGDEVTVEVYGSVGSGLVATSIMANVGNVALQWQHSAGEIYNTNVLMNMNGIRVNSWDGLGYTAITPDEFAGYSRGEDGNMERVFTLNGQTTEMKKARMEDELAMNPLKIIVVESDKYHGWAFIPDE